MTDENIRKNLVSIYRVILLSARAHGVEIRALTVRYDTFFEDYTVFLGQPGETGKLGEVLNGCVGTYLSLECRYVFYRGYASYDFDINQPFVQENEIGYLLKVNFIDYGRAYKTFELSPENFNVLKHGKN